VTFLVRPLGHMYCQVENALPLFVDVETRLTLPGPLRLYDQWSNSYQSAPLPVDSGAVAPMGCDCPLGTKALVGLTLTDAIPDGLLCPCTVRRHP